MDDYQKLVKRIYSISSYLDDMKNIEKKQVGILETQICIQKSFEEIIGKWCSLKVKVDSEQIQKVRRCPPLELLNCDIHADNLGFWSVGINHVSILCLLK